MDTRPILIVVLGATGVGKTELSIRLAQHFASGGVVSSDSRQVYREIPIGTAAPTLSERAAVPHYLVGHISIHDHYSAGAYEVDALETIRHLHAESRYAVLSGGSMMYVDALCRGIDSVPTADPEIRQALWYRYEQEGLDGILGELRILDPVYYARVDRQNHKRVIHGLEICLSSGQPFSSFHQGEAKPRPWQTIKVGLRREREELYQRIDQRVYAMLEAGLLEEAKAVYPYRHLNALNTVGYKELFAYFDGAIDLPEAIRLIQRNSRHYARKQMSWWQRDPDIRWFHPSDIDGVISCITQVSTAP